MGLAETHKKHISESLKGHIPWNKGINGYTTSWKGGKMSKKAKRKMSRNHWSKTRPEEFKKFLERGLPTNPTPYEDLFYEKFKDRFILKRQKQVGPYTCDFYFPTFNLIVEIDGYEKPKERDDFIKSKGFDVLHIENEEVLRITDGNIIKKTIEYPFCLCGCRKRVKHSRNSYIIGHWIRVHPVSLATIKKAAESRRGKPTWNNGLTKETDERLMRISKNVSKAKKGKPANLSEEGRKRKAELTKQRNLKDNPAKRPEVKEKLRQYYFKRITLPNVPRRGEHY